jgi:hypothetical protein
MQKHTQKIKKKSIIISIIMLVLIVNTLPVSANGWHANLGDYVWNDLNRDGIQDDNESGVEGITVYLYYCTNDTIARPPLITKSDGSYYFEQLIPALYYVKFILPSGWVFSPQNNTDNDEKDSDVDVITGKTDCYYLPHFETNLTFDAGIYRLCNGSIGDRVWLDSNLNGTQDLGEENVSGVTVIISIHSTRPGTI